MVDRFVDAFQRGDLDSVLDLLSNDARLSMPPEPIQCHGPAAIADFLQQRRFWGPEPDTPADACQRPTGVRVLPAGPKRPRVTSERGDRPHSCQDHVSTLTRFGGRDIIARFGLPSALPLASLD